MRERRQRSTLLQMLREVALPLRPVGSMEEGANASQAPNINRADAAKS